MKEGKRVGKLVARIKLFVASSICPVTIFPANVGRKIDYGQDEGFLLFKDLFLFLYFHWISTWNKEQFWLQKLCNKSLVIKIIISSPIRGTFPSNCKAFNTKKTHPHCDSVVRVRKMLADFSSWNLRQHEIIFLRNWNIKHSTQVAR